MGAARPPLSLSLSYGEWTAVEGLEGWWTGLSKHSPRNPSQESPVKLTHLPVKTRPRPQSLPPYKEEDNEPQPYVAHLYKPSVGRQHYITRPRRRIWVLYKVGWPPPRASPPAYWSERESEVSGAESVPRWHKEPLDTITGGGICMCWPSLCNKYIIIQVLQRRETNEDESPVYLHCFDYPFFFALTWVLSLLTQTHARFLFLCFSFGLFKGELHHLYTRVKPRCLLLPICPTSWWSGGLPHFFSPLLHSHLVSFPFFLVLLGWEATTSFYFSLLFW